MVAYSDWRLELQYVPGTVCPDCNEPIHGISIEQTRPDRYDRIIRRYYGWCLRCKVGSYVEQFLMDHRWYIHRYRQWVMVDGKPVNKGGWTILNDLPDPAPIVLGPGGGYDKAIEL